MRLMKNGEQKMKNVLTNFVPRPAYYLSHPLEFFRTLKRNLIAAWQRTTRGYADQDTWSMDAWFFDVVPSMLERLAKCTHGYPAHLASEDEWTDELYDLAARIRSCSEEEQEKANEYWRAYHDALDKCTFTFKERDNGYEASFANEPSNMREITLKYNERTKQISDEAAKRLEAAMIEFAKILPDLWD